jgi:uncharacterized protein DUF2203
MKPHRYAPADAKALAPLLDSIGRELVERGVRLAELETRIAELRASPFYADELHQLEAEAAEHRRALRLCRAELEQLGCSVVGTSPLTVRIPTRIGKSNRSLVWQHGREAEN